VLRTTWAGCQVLDLDYPAFRWFFCLGCVDVCLASYSSDQVLQDEEEGESMNRREFLRGVGASLVALLFGKGKQPGSALQIAEAAQKVVECGFDAAAQQILDSADKYNEVAGQVTFGVWFVSPEYEIAESIQHGPYWRTLPEQECVDCLKALPPLRDCWVSVAMELPETLSEDG
jgi:hypothetical protein